MLGCPQVVSYRVSKITYAIVRKKINSRFVSLPNIMADDWCVPELLQNAATPDALVSAMCGLIDHEHLRARMQAAYAMMGEALQSPATSTFDPMVAAVLAELR